MELTSAPETGFGMLCEHGSMVERGVGEPSPDCRQMPDPILSVGASVVTAISVDPVAGGGRRTEWFSEKDVDMKTRSLGIAAAEGTKFTAEKEGRQAKVVGAWAAGLGRIVGNELVYQHCTD